MIERTLNVLRTDPELEVVHLPFRFTGTLTHARRVQFRKIAQLAAVVHQLVKLRLKGPIALALYPIGGPHLVPLIRDLALLPFFILLCEKVSLNIHAGGIAETLPDLHSTIRRLAIAIYRRCEEAVVLTEFSRRDAEALGIDRIFVVPNRLPDCFNPANVDKRSESLELVYIGHFSKEKGVPDLLHAVAAIRHEHPEVQLTLVGEPIRPHTLSEIKEQIASLGLTEIVSLSGVLESHDKWERYARSDLLVFPSTALESFPLVLLEAMMWELPVVATDWRSHREILGEPPGGICFPIGDDLRSSLEAALRAAIRNRSKWPAWGKQNRHRFLSMAQVTPDPMVSYVRHSVALKSPIDLAQEPTPRQ